MRVRVRATYPYGEPVKGAMVVNVAPLKGAPQPLINGEAEVILRPVAGRSTHAEITVRDGADREARAVVDFPQRSHARGQIAILAEPLVVGQPGAIAILTTDAKGGLGRLDAGRSDRPGAAESGW
jgi:hypothetical protein